MGRFLAHHGEPLSSSAEPQPGFASTYGFGLLYDQPPALDPKTLVARLAPATPTELLSASDSVIHLSHPDLRVASSQASSTSIERSAKPVVAGDYAAALEQTWDWPEAEPALARCGYRIRVCDLTGAGLLYDVRYRLISTVVLAVVELTDPTVCHWEPAGCLVEPKRLARNLAWPFNVRAVALDPGRESLMDTLGLAALGLIDAQCYYRGLDRGQMARWMYGVGRKLFTDGGVITEEDSIPGLRPNERWTWRRQSAMLPPTRPVIDVKPPASHSGRHNIVAIVP